MHYNKLLFGAFLLLSSTSFAQTEPASNPTNFRVKNLRHWDANVLFSKSTADSFLVLRSESPLSATPTDDVIYQKGQWLGNGKVVSAGKSDSIYAREFTEGTKYYFTVFAYNKVGTNTNYKQINPLIDSFTTPAMNPFNYYQGVVPGSSNFLSSLTALINNHTFVSYESYKYNIVPAIWERDTTGGQVTSFCAYSGVKTVYPFPITFGSAAGLYSKEHCLPRSWMRTGGDTNNKDGADFFNLLVTIYNEANFKRSNYPYGIALTPTYTYGNFKLGRDVNNILVAEPQDEYKGDAARNMMYQMVSYNGQSGTWGLDNLSGLALQQNEAVLKQWNIQDPPSKLERTKNEYIFSIQFNRNPFIDNPSWVDCINFRNITYNNCIAGIEDWKKEALNYSWKDKQTATITLSNLTTNTVVSLFNTSGQELYKIEIPQNGIDQNVDIPLSSLSSGIYFLSIQNSQGKASVKIPYFN